ncbi:hypothetical protein GW17_00030414, partial [Ensete ventricosum]
QNPKEQARGLRSIPHHHFLASAPSNLPSGFGSLRRPKSAQSDRQSEPGGREEGKGGMEGGVTYWQALFLSSILGWVVASSQFDLTRRVRAMTQPRVTRRVLADTPSILRLQVNTKAVYLLHYVLENYPQRDGIVVAIMLGLIFLLVMLIGVGEMTSTWQNFFGYSINSTKGLRNECHICLRKEKRSNLGFIILVLDILLFGV